LIMNVFSQVNIVRQTHLFFGVVLKECLLKNTALFHYKKYSMKHAVNTMHSKLLHEVNFTDRGH